MIEKERKQEDKASVFILNVELNFRTNAIYTFIFDYLCSFPFYYVYQ